jgi:hypothetical protein
MPKLDMLARATKRPAVIAAKRANIGAQIDALRRNERIAIRVGGIDRVTMGDEIAFQEWRASVAEWAEAADLKAITARMAEIDQALGVDGQAARTAGIMTGLPAETVRLICEWELLALAVGA